MTLHFLFLYCLTVFIASIIPGPSMLLALTHGIQYGARKTIASALGNVTVTLVQAAISITGLGTILIASESVFHLIKWIGAAYLIYLGISFLVSSRPLVTKSHRIEKTTFRSLRKMYVQGALVTAGNPKAILFFTAVFPQFLDPGSAYLYQSCILLSLCALIAFSCYMMYAIGGQKIVSLFSKAGVGKYCKKVIGTTFIGAGIGLAVSNK